MPVEVLSKVSIAGKFMPRSNKLHNASSRGTLLELWNFNKIVVTLKLHGEVSHFRL